MSAANPKLELRRVDAGVMLAVRLTPKSACDEIAGIEAFDGACVLRARVRALPEKGRANQALERLIAHWLGLPPSSVSVARGGKSRLKQVLIEADPETVARLVETQLAALAG